MKLLWLVLLVISCFNVQKKSSIREKIYDKLPPPTPEEEDLLDLAYGLT